MLIIFIVTALLWHTSSLYKIPVAAITAIPVVVPVLTGVVITAGI